MNRIRVQIHLFNDSTRKEYALGIDRLDFDTDADFESGIVTLFQSLKQAIVEEMRL